MKNKIVLVLVAVLFGFSIVNEPIDDTIDIIAGATNETYGTSPDVIGGASEDRPDREDHDDDDEYEYEDEEDDD